MGEYCRNDLEGMYHLIPFHHWRAPVVRARALYKILQLDFFSFAYVARTLAFVACVFLFDRIKSPKSIGHTHYSDATECDPSHCNATNKH